ncbi:homoserine kinase [Nesterenkonia halobia]|uniref:Homoserine kinase n=1 Tax=Nesterenkonia halobia TaxID=37922 RepID=A0ABP6RIZ0_9MICC
MSTASSRAASSPEPVSVVDSAPDLVEALDAPCSMRLRVPATSANLGPGYDCMGLALGLHDEIVVEAAPRAAEAAAEVRVDVDGEGAEALPTDASHLVVTLIERILAARGFRLPDLTVRASNRIPHSRGLGSSAAAIASAVAVADQLLPEGLDADEQLQIGARIEGHPDNYAPALRGGLAVSWREGETFRTARLRPHPRLRTVLAVPAAEQSTTAARGVLPEQIAHAEAADNSARSALLVHALTAEPELLLPATEDRLHQQQRRGAFPASMALVDRLRDAGHAAVISGAGPSVLVLADGDEAAEAARRRIGEAVDVVDPAAAGAEGGRDHEGGLDTWRSLILPISDVGATVEAHRR